MMTAAMSANQQRANPPRPREADAGIGLHSHTSPRYANGATISTAASSRENAPSDERHVHEIAGDVE